MKQTDSYPWKNYSFLILLSIIAAAANLPYTNALFGNVQKELGFSQESFMIVTFLQTLIFMAVTAFFGLFFSRRGGLKTPVLDTLVYRYPAERPIGKTLFLSVMVGTVSGSLILLINTILEPYMTYTMIEGSASPGLVASLGVCLYGGIAEEIMLRLFCTNLFLWLLRHLYNKQSNTPIMISIILSALIFGLLHVLSGLNAMEMDVIFIVRTISLNMIMGIVFGILYWKWGLIPAMLGHGIADVILHVLPLL